jgi:MFS family permease
MSTLVPSPVAALRAVRERPLVRQLVLLYTATVLVGTGQGTLVPTIPALDDAFGVSAGAAAQVITAYGIGRFAGMVAGGTVVDRWGPRLAVTVGPVVLAASAVGALLTPWFALLLVMVFILGTGDAFWQMGREITGVELVRADQRGRLLSGFMGFHAVGISTGAVVGGLITDGVGYRGVFVFYLSMALLVLALGRLMSTPPHRRHEAPASAAPVRGGLVARIAGLREIFLAIDPALRLSYAIFVFTTLSMMTYRMVYQAIMPVYAADELGMSSTQVGLLFSIIGVFSLLMIVPSGLLTDKKGRKWATVPSTLIPGVAFMLLPLSTMQLHMVFIGVGIGIANGLSLGSIATSTYDVAPAHVRGRLQAVRRTVAEVGGIGGPMLGGFLTNAHGPGMAFWATGPLALVAAALLFFVARETLVKPRREVG